MLQATTVRLLGTLGDSGSIKASAEPWLKGLGPLCCQDVPQRRRDRLVQWKANISADSSFPSALAARVAAAFYLRGLADGPDKELSRSMSQIQRHGDDYWVIDGSHGSEPFCQMINSPAGGDAPNLRLLPNGVLEVIARQIAPLSELLFEYGEWYRFDRKDEQSCEDSVL